MRCTVVVLATVLTTSVAAAQAPGQPAFDPSITATPVAPASTPTAVSYRAQTLLADGISAALTMAGPLAAPEISVLGLAGYAVAAPIIHVAHGRGSAAAKSFALRIGLAGLGAAIGKTIAPADGKCTTAQGSETCDEVEAGLLVGFAAGAVAAIAVDAIYLARYETHHTPTWTARVSPTTGGVALGVGRSF